MKKYKFTVPFFKENFNVKNFCEELDYLFKKKQKEPPIYSFILYHTIFDEVGKFFVARKIDKNYKETDFDKYSEKIDDEFMNNKKNEKFKKWMIKSAENGTLLEKLSNNFKLIYNFQIAIPHSLVFSKLNNKYYHFEFYAELTSEESVGANLTSNTFKETGYYDLNLINVFNKKITFYEFFDHIISVNEKHGFDPKKNPDDHEIYQHQNVLTGKPDYNVPNFYYMEKDEKEGESGSLELWKKYFVKE